MVTKSSVREMEGDGVAVDRRDRGDVNVGSIDVFEHARRIAAGRKRDHHVGGPAWCHVFDVVRKRPEERDGTVRQCAIGHGCDRDVGDGSRGRCCHVDRAWHDADRCDICSIRPLVYRHAQHARGTTRAELLEEVARSRVGSEVIPGVVAKRHLGEAGESRTGDRVDGTVVAGRRGAPGHADRHVFRCRP